MPNTKNLGGRPSYVPIDTDRAKINTMAGLGLNPSDIALVIGISTPTLRKYFKKELAHGTAQAESQMAQSLYQQGMGIKNKEGELTLKPNVVATIFWLKCRAGWREDGLDLKSGDSPPPAKVLVEFKDRSKPEEEKVE